LEIKYLDKSDQKEINELKDLWKIVFSERDIFIKWYFDEIPDSNRTTYLLKVDGHIASTLQVLKYDFCLFGHKVKGGYIAGVGTMPEHRKKGFLSMLLKKALNDMYNEGFVFANLIPTNPAYYKSSGFESVYKCKYINISGLSKYQTNETFNEDFSDIDPIYKEAVKGKNGYIIRTDSDWHEIITSCQVEEVKILRTQKSYFIYKVYDDTLHVLESAFFSENELWGFLGKIKEMYPQVKRAKIRTYYNKYDEIKDFAMARIVNAKAVCEMLNINDVGVYDPIIPQNNFTPSNSKSMDIGMFTDFVFSKGDNVINLICWVQ